jgi:hypothetical protein
MSLRFKILFSDCSMDIELSGAHSIPHILMALNLAGFKPAHHSESDTALAWVRCHHEGKGLDSQDIQRDIEHCLSCIEPPAGR